LWRAVTTLFDLLFIDKEDGCYVRDTSLDMNFSPSSKRVIVTGKLLRLNQIDMMRHFY